MVVAVAKSVFGTLVAAVVAPPNVNGDVDEMDAVGVALVVATTPAKEKAGFALLGLVVADVGGMAAGASDEAIVAGRTNFGMEDWLTGCLVGGE